jgi:hypothetical protein
MSDLRSIDDGMTQPAKVAPLPAAAELMSEKWPQAIFPID